MLARKIGSFLTKNGYGGRCCRTHIRGLAVRPEPIDGQATPEGTKRFVARSKLPLYHHFMRSKLVINPIIHGPPLPSLVKKMNAEGTVSTCFLGVTLHYNAFCFKDPASGYLIKAVCDHHCNAVYVFDWETKWAFKDMHKLIKRQTASPAAFQVCKYSVCKNK
jgi:hypothetical protein